jgi:hypothetical protein
MYCDITVLRITLKTIGTDTSLMTEKSKSGTL